MLEWESILANAANDGTIRELHLSKIPVLKTTDNWNKVKVIGWVDHKLKHSHYKGVLVKLNDKLYFVKESTMEALKGYIKWKVSKKISVIPG